MKRFYQTLMLVFITIAAYSQGTQTVRGTVAEETSKMPVAGALVVILLPDGTQIGTSTDTTGYFKLSNVPLGRQTLKVTYAGYEPFTYPDITVTAGKEIILTVSLTEDINLLKDLTVTYDDSQDKAKVNNNFATVSARTFNTDDTKRYAGSLGDPSRMAANFAGVVSGNDSRNDIVIRGNSPTSMLWQMEGLNIPNPNHFGSISSSGGPVSILNNNVIGKSDFITSAFPSQYGNGIAGVFDLKMRNGNDEKREWMGQVGFNGFEAGAEGPVNKKRKSSYLINYRYSTLGFFKMVGINFGTGNAVPNYQDVNFKINLPVSEKAVVSIFGMGGTSDVNFMGNEVDTNKVNLYSNENENSMVKFGMGVLGSSIGYQLSKKTYARLTLGVSGTRQVFNSDSIGAESRLAYPSEALRIYTGKYSTVLNINHKINAKNSLNSGVTFDLSSFDIQDKIIFDGGKNDSMRVNVDGEKTLLTQAFTQLKHRFSTRLFVTAGLHFQHYSLSNSVALEPRAGIKYSFGRAQSIGFGYGLHSQVQNPYTSYLQSPGQSGVPYTNKDLGFTRSHHTVMTYENNITQNLLVRIETYYQYIFDAPVEKFPSSFSALNTGASFDFATKTNLTNKGTGSNYGLELTFERFFNKGFFFLMTTSLFNSKYKGSDGIERNTAFNTHYIFNILGGKEIRLGKTSVLGLNVKFSTVGGKYFSPLDVQASSKSRNAVYDDQHAYSNKQTPYLRSDIKITYRKEFSKSTFEFSLDLQNISNHKNIFLQSYNPRTNQIENKYQQGFFPVPYCRYTF